LRVNFVMMRQNYREYADVIELAASLGAIDVVPMPVDSRRRELRLSKRLIRAYNAEVAPRVAVVRREQGFSSDPLRIHPFGASRRAIAEAAEGRYAGGYYQDHLCYAPYTHVFVAWDGKVYLCCMTNARMAPLGDLSRESLAAVFRGPAFDAVRRSMLVTRPESCHACDMYLEENRSIAAGLGSLPPPEAALPRRSLPLLA
jgi:MoaA/NifB/PqqE/SkfB family radical SAM enzyme